MIGIGPVVSNPAPRRNIVRDNTGVGFFIRPANGTDPIITADNSILRGSITNNSLAGIELAAGANEDIPPPTITSVNMSDGGLTVTGQSAANALVQIYADQSPFDEGRYFLGSVTANEIADSG